MSRDPLRVPNYLDHIIDSIDRIFRYCAGLDDTEFFSNQLIQDAVIRNFAVIGEASRNIERVAPEFVEANPDIPLSFAYDMRNILVHGYYQVDLKIVWDTVKHDLPPLRDRVVAVRRSIESGL